MVNWLAHYESLRQLYFKYLPYYESLRQLGLKKYLPYYDLRTKEEYDQELVDAEHFIIYSLKKEQESFREHCKRLFTCNSLECISESKITSV